MWYEGQDEQFHLVHETSCTSSVCLICIEDPPLIVMVKFGDNVVLGSVFMKVRLRYHNVAKGMYATAFHQHKHFQSGVKVEHMGKVNDAP